jgi:hypothetical protein
MNQEVTPRSIAYAAVQVSLDGWISVENPNSKQLVQLHFALQTAGQWCRFYDDFDYEEFYNFVVDYFEADASPEARKAARELLDWWNK